MAAPSFELNVFADSQGRTCVSLTDHAGKRHRGVPLTFVGERALYELLQQVRAHEHLRPLDVLEGWSPAERHALGGSPWQVVPVDMVPQLEPHAIEEAVNKCDF